MCLFWLYKTCQPTLLTNFAPIISLINYINLRKQAKFLREQIVAVYSLEGGFFWRWSIKRICTSSFFTCGEAGRSRHAQCCSSYCFCWGDHFGLPMCFQKRCVKRGVFKEMCSERCVKPKRTSKFVTLREYLPTKLGLLGRLLIFCCILGITKCLFEDP